ncbi:MAG: carboxylating nicotinate-nucleotide diphosphorylase [Desulfobacteraceae bacterium]|nr:carboxylating nicotinate-nucleotide diphosphorylase [Desulfobacteraceae bacterium]
MNLALNTLIDLALAEDIGTGDITTDAIVAPDKTGAGTIVAKEQCVLAGLDVAKAVFARVDNAIEFKPACSDGQLVAAGDTVVTLKGPLAGLLKGERTALNFLQRLSGIATNTHAYTRELTGSRARLVDTRKTTPGWRVLEKYAVRMGGGSNHRMGLFDGVLIKDNHIEAAGGIQAAVTKVRRELSHLIKIEVETATLEQVDEAIAAGADVIMLDNMDADQIKAAVKIVNKKALIEVSGGINRGNLKNLAASGVDIISVGALTHSARAVDLSMYIH